MADPQNDKQAKKLRAEFESLKRETAGFKDLFDDLPETLDELIRKMGSQEGALKYLREMKREVNDMKSDFFGIAKIYADTVQEYRSGNLAIRDSVKATSKLKDLADKLKYDQLEVSELSEKELSTIIKKIQQQQIELEVAIASGKLSKEQIKQNEKTIALSQIQLQGAAERLEQEKKINQQLGLTGQAVKGLANALSKYGIGSFLNMEEITKRMREAAKDGASKWKVFGVGIREVFASVGDALRDPVTQITAIYKGMQFLIKSALAYRDRIFEAGKNLGLGVTQSEKLYKNFLNIAIENGKLAVTAKELVESYAKINDSLGFMGPQNQEFLTTATAIDRRLGTSAEEMQNIYLYSASQKKTLKESYGIIIGSAKATAANLKIAMTEKQIISAISKLSATVFNNFKGNTKQLAESVVKATKLGTTLDQINQAGMSMLDFESSISKEFEAQLLTGKNIDLSRARQLALTGSTAELMEEITKQLGSQDEWNSMNVLKQQSLAEALGMSKEAVDEMFKKQQLANLLGEKAGADAKTQYDYLRGQHKSHEEIAKILGQEAINDVMRVSASEKLQKTMENIQNLIGKIADSYLFGFLDKISNILSDSKKIKVVFGGLAAIATLLVGRAVYLSVMRQKEMADQTILLNLQRAQLASQLLKNKAITDAATRTRLLQIQEQSLARTSTLSAGGKIASFLAGFIGPLAVPAAIASIMGLLSMIGGGGGGGGSVATPNIPSYGGQQGNPISPMNQSTANLRASQSTSSTTAKGGTTVVINDQSKLDPITGKKMYNVFAQTYDEATSGVNR